LCDNKDERENRNKYIISYMFNNVLS